MTTIVGYIDLLGVLRCCACHERAGLVTATPGHPYPAAVTAGDVRGALSACDVCHGVLDDSEPARQRRRDEPTALARDS